MKILVVSENFYPDIFAINDIVRILVQRGHKVTVLTGLPDYTTTEIPKEFKHGKKRHEKYEGAEVFRIPTIARRHGPVWRSLNYLSFVHNGKKFIKSQKLDFDVIYVWEVSPVTMTIPAIKAKEKYRKPLFLYCLDIWPECIKAMGFKEGSFFYNIIKDWSGKIYRSCDHIAVTSKPFFTYLAKVDGVSRKKMSYLPQFASSEMLGMDFEKEKNGHWDFLYIGNIGNAQDMPCMIKAIAKLKEKKDITFHIIGGGTAFEATKRLAKETGAEKIIAFYGPKPFKEAMQYYKKADACIMTLDGSNYIGDTLPGKLQTYMAAGKPVIGAINGAGQEVIKESGCGLCVNAGNSEGLGKAFAEFIENNEKYKDCGRKSREYFKEHFTEEKHFEELEKQLNELAGRSHVSI